MSYPQHLSYRELGRYAFLAGDGFTAALAETADDLEQENLDYFNNQDSLRTQAFEAGKLQGLGEDVQATITGVTQEAARLRDQLAKATELLGSCHAWLQGDQTKTIKGRREAAHSLANRMTGLGLGYPRH
jgi:hypothetical protein